MRQFLNRRMTWAAMAVVAGMAVLAWGIDEPHSKAERACGSVLDCSYDKMLQHEESSTAGGGAESEIQATASLESTLDWARRSLEDIRGIHGYCCTLVKREWVKGQLIGPHYMAIKVRQKPFSVYLRYLAPRDVRNREVIYVDGQNQGKLLAHGTGTQQRLFGMIALKPTGPIAMHDNRHPLTELGIQRLVEH